MKIKRNDFVDNPIVLLEQLKNKTVNIIINKQKIASIFSDTLQKS